MFIVIDAICLMFMIVTILRILCVLESCNFILLGCQSLWTLGYIYSNSLIHINRKNISDCLCLSFPYMKRTLF